MSPMLTNLGSCCAWNFGGSGGVVGFSADNAAMAETLNKSPAPPRAKTYLCMVPPILLDAVRDLTGISLSQISGRFPSTVPPTVLRRHCLPRRRADYDAAAW